MKTHIPPANGGFLILRCADRVILGLAQDKNRWEIPGGGEEEIDMKDLLKTAIRETDEEVRLRVKKEHAILVGSLIQIIPNTGGKTGIVGVWQTQVFEPNQNLRWNNFDLFSENEPARNDETQKISLIRLRDIFCDNPKIIVPLGHKRMILHSLNTFDSQVPLNEGFRLSDRVTALVPHLGNVEC